MQQVLTNRFEQLPLLVRPVGIVGRLDSGKVIELLGLGCSKGCGDGTENLFVSAGGIDGLSAASTVNV